MCYTYLARYILLGTSDIMFGYNGRDGVVTDKNGLIYMRARYYSPEMRRFINADIIAGKLNNAVTLNRYAYANANPAMFIDPTGLFGFFTALAAVAVVGISLLIGGSSKREKTSSSSNMVSTSGSSRTSSKNTSTSKNNGKTYTQNDVKIAAQSGETIPSNRIVNKNNNHSIANDGASYVPNPNANKNQSSTSSSNSEIDYEQQYIEAKNQQSTYDMVDNALSGVGYAWEIGNPLLEGAMIKSLYNAPRPNNIGVGTYNKMLEADEAFIKKGVKYTGYGLTAITTAISTGMGIEQNIKNGESAGEIWSDAAIDIGGGVVSIIASAKIGAAVGTTISPGVGTLLGILVALGINWGSDKLDNFIEL